jgi:hypothetical protein
VCENDTIEQHVFAFLLIIEGTTEKLLQFIIMSLVSLDKKCILEPSRVAQTRKSLLIDIIFSMKKNSNDLFRATLCRLVLVLEKDVLFH